MLGGILFGCLFGCGGSENGARSASLREAMSVLLTRN
jgi:hypothetical protein